MQDREHSHELEILQKLAGMEQQLKQMEEIKKDIKQLTVQLGKLGEVYLPRSEAQAFNVAREQQLKNLDEKIAGIESRVRRIEGGIGWIFKIIGTILVGALLSLILIKYK